jgi:hypothetical protein
MVAEFKKEILSKALSMELQSRRIAEIFSLVGKATQMNYQTKYLEDNAITKKEYNFPNAICLLFTQIGFAQFTIPENQLYRLLFMIMQMF